MGVLMTGLFVFFPDEPVIQILMNPDVTGLSHQFDLFYHYNELHGRREVVKR